jgi:asparagine synthase (glutamine-hydrolysing)
MLVVCDSDLYNSQSSPSGGAAKLIADYYRKYGSSFLNELHGAFSLALWDQRSRSLIIAVDRLGIKRLCYAEDGPAIIFATQPSGILAGKRIPKNVSLPAITDYFSYNVIPAPKTAFERIHKVSPGHYLLWNESGIQTKRYWDMSYSENARGTPQALAQELLSGMKSAVRSASAGIDHSRAGCFLSGGTDSSSIVGLCTELHKRPVKAFSIGFSEERFNELEYARLAATHFRAQHVEGRLSAEDALDIVDKIVAAYDEPFANSSAIPSYFCAKLAHENGIEVLLAGDGGDELFGGNERYRKEQVFHSYQKIPSALRERIIEPVFAKNGETGLNKIQNYIQTAKMGNPERYCRWRMLQKFSPELVLGAEMPFRNGHSDLLAAMRGHYKSAPAHSELNRLLYVDVKMTLGDDDLPKVTRTAEMAGVSVRFPYLDHELAEFSGRLPADLKVHKLEKRYLFKLATQQLLPKEILQKKKHGFGLPIGLWLKTHSKWHARAKEVLFDPKTYQRGYFRREFVEQLFANMQQDATPYFGDLIWVFLMLELWHRHHIERSIN